jgi:hypothetical protein
VFYTNVCSPVKLSETADRADDNSLRSSPTGRHHPALQERGGAA